MAQDVEVRKAGELTRAAEASTQQLAESIDWFVIAVVMLVISPIPFGVMYLLTKEADIQGVRFVFATIVTGLSVIGALVAALVGVKAWALSRRIGIGAAVQVTVLRVRMGRALALSAAMFFAFWVILIS